MRRLFLRFYLTLVVCFLISYLVIGAFYKQLIDRTNQRYLTDIFQTTITIIERELGDLPLSLWHDTVSQIADKIPLPVQVEAIDAYSLSAENMAGLKGGDIILLYGEDLYLHRIHDTGLMVVLGPIPFLARFDAISWEDVLAVFLMCLALGIPTWLWMRPFWRDLISLSRQGRQLGLGDFSARVELGRHSALEQLGSAFNRMAHDVEELTVSRRAMIDAVSHDLRTPLARLRYRLEAIKSGIDTEKQFAAIERDLGQIDDLIQEWLTMSSLDRTRAVMEPQSLEIVPWLQRLVGEYAGEQGAPEVCNASGMASPLVDVDSYYFGRAIGNLLVNARRYGGDKVMVVFAWEGGWASVHVDDNGPGIPQADRSRLLQPFERMEASRNRATGGFGLGLSIVAMIMAGHGGRVEIADSPMGGARVSLSWPSRLRPLS
jgi:two-component system, OmpR family, sensor histidine kinase RstB